MNKFALAIILSLVWVTVSSALDLTRVNFNFQYDTNWPVRTLHRLVETDDSLTVFYSLEKRTTDTTSVWKQLIFHQPRYASIDHDTLGSLNIDVIETGIDRKEYYRFSLAKPISGVIIVQLVNVDLGITHIHDISVDMNAQFPDFLPVSTSKIPLLERYSTTSEVTFSGGGDDYLVYKYIEDFGPADPAMGTMKPIAPTLSIDSTFGIARRLSDLENYHFYLTQKDSLASTGVTLLSVPGYFPKYRRLEELIPPLTYITTTAEIEKLTGSMTKENFESFWIDTYGSKRMAKQAIKEYYDKIEKANRLFTDYKAGWKTDRGIIYIIFGLPSSVERTERSELWVYPDGAEFEFIRLSTLFTSSMYSLKRDRKYEKMWYQQVGDIRKGF